MNSLFPKYFVSCSGAIDTAYISVFHIPFYLRSLIVTCNVRTIFSRKSKFTKSVNCMFTFTGMKLSNGITVLT